MKLLVYFSVLFVVEATINVCIPPPSSDATSANIDNVFKKINKKIVDKLEELSDGNEFVIKEDHIDIDIKHPAIRIEGAVDNVTISNLLNFEMCFLDHIFVNKSYYQFDPFNITFRNLRVEGKYNLRGDLGDIFDIFGAGDFWIELGNFSISMVNFTFDVNEEICFPINLNVYLSAMNNNFSQLMFDEELGLLINNCITTIVPEVLQIIWGEWKELFDKPLEDAINDILHNHEIQSIFGVLKNRNANITTPKFCYTPEGIQ